MTRMMRDKQIRVLEKTKVKLMFMTMMGWFFGWRMGINEDIAAMEEACQRMKRLLVWENPDAYYINEAGALIRRSRNGTETVAVARPTSFNGSIKE